MAGIPDTVLIAVIMAMPTLLVYFGSQKKQAAETQNIISDNWSRLNKAQNDFSDQMEDRLTALNKRISDQDATIAQQNSTIAKQNETITAQSARIAEQDRITLEQRELITDLTKQIEGMGQTPVHKRGKPK